MQAKITAPAADGIDVETPLDGWSDRNHLAHSTGDAIYAALAGARYNFLVLLSQKVAGDRYRESVIEGDWHFSMRGLRWVSEQQTTVNRDLRGMSRGL